MLKLATRKQIRILHLISSSGFYGAENMIVESARAFQPGLFHPIIAIINNKHHRNEELLDKAQGYGIEAYIFSCNGKVDFRAISALRRFIRLNSVDILHTHGYKANIYGVFATFFSRTQRIATCHNWLSKTAKMGFYEKLDKLFLKFFKKIVVVSKPLRQELMNTGISSDKIAVITNGVDVDQIQCQHNVSQLRKSLGITEKEMIIGTVGRLAEEKGHRYLLEAFARVVTEFPNTKLLLVGEGPLKGELQAASHKLKIEDKVMFMGIRDDVPQMLSIMDVFVLSSLTEGTPMALLEAMAAQKAIIASRVGAIPDIIDDKVDGILVPAGDVEALHSVLVLLIQNQELAVGLGRNAYSKVKRDFSANRMAVEYEHAYESLLTATGYFSPKGVVL